MIMKRYLMAIILVVCLSVSLCVRAEGLLPTLEDTIGKPMPSLGEALGRYPDEEIQSVDGSVTEVFRDVIDTDYSTFSIYLSEQSAILSDYLVSGSIISASIKVDEMTFFFNYNTQTKEATVTYPNGTYDRWLDYAKTQFESAVRLLDAGKTNDALAVLLTIPEYCEFRPVVECFESYPELAMAKTEVKRKPFREVGNVVTFGTYPQTSEGNDSTPIEWIVLDVQDNKVLLISRYGLDAKPYNAEAIGVTWGKCSLRAWLNGEFYREAFSVQEQGGIMTTNVDNSKNQGYIEWSQDSDDNTQDKIFLLSYAEANKYFGVTFENRKNTKARVEPTAYTMKKIHSYKTGQTEPWWLRSTFSFIRAAATVHIDGSLGNLSVETPTGCIRPALWLNLEADIF